MANQKTCGKKTEIYSRIVGYFRPVENWNGGKKEEFKDRLEYCVNTSLNSKAGLLVEVVEKEKEAVAA